MKSPKRVTSLSQAWPSYGHLPWSTRVASASDAKTTIMVCLCLANRIGCNHHGVQHAL